MVPALIAQDHRLAIQILDDDVDVAVVEEIAETNCSHQVDLDCKDKPSAATFLPCKPR